MSIFQPLEVVCRGSETQLQVAAFCLIIVRFKGKSGKHGYLNCISELDCNRFRF